MNCEKTKDNVPESNSDRGPSRAAFRALREDTLRRLNRFARRANHETPPEESTVSDSDHSAPSPPPDEPPAAASDPDLPVRVRNTNNNFWAAAMRQGRVEIVHEPGALADTVAGPAGLRRIRRRDIFSRPGTPPEALQPGGVFYPTRAEDDPPLDPRPPRGLPLKNLPSASAQGSNLGWVQSGSGGRAVPAVPV